MSSASWRAPRAFSRAEMETVAKLAADGKLKAPRIHRFPLEKAGEAIKLLGQTDGKIVVTI